MPPTPAPTANKHHILVLSDDHNKRVVMMEHLHNKGYKSSGGFDLNIAVQIICNEKLRPAPIDLVIVNAPNGHDVAEALYARLIEINLMVVPVIVTLNERSYRIQRGSITSISDINLKELAEVK